MSKKFKVWELPKEIQESINATLSKVEKPRYVYLSKQLKDAGHNVSKSALHRYGVWYKKNKNSSSTVVSSKQNFQLDKSFSYCAQRIKALQYMFPTASFKEILDVYDRCYDYTYYLQPPF